MAPSCSSCAQQVGLLMSIRLLLPRSAKDACMLDNKWAYFHVLVLLHLVASCFLTLQAVLQVGKCILSGDFLRSTTDKPAAV